MRQVGSYPLWLGHAGDARPITPVLDKGIQALLDLAWDEPLATVTRDLVYCRFPLVDGGGNPPWLLRGAIMTAAELIRAQVPTLICCSMGLSRSPAIAAAALAVATNQKPEECLAVVVPPGGKGEITPGLWKEVCAVLTARDRHNPESGIPSVVRPNYDHLVTQDDAPAENWIVSAQRRLLVSPLYAFWSGPPEGGSFVAGANVGLFDTDRTPLPTTIPDMLLSLGVALPSDIHCKENSAYFVWLFGKFPDVIVEIVANAEGGEDSWKPKHYAKIKVPYYIIFDPWQYLKKGVLRVMELSRGKYKAMREPYWLPDVGLGLKLWEGEYDGRKAIWLRWCDRNGNLIPTGQEKAERLAAKLRELGVDPEA